MADSWEDDADEKIVLQPKRLNANAPTFSFNPGASTFSPGSSAPTGPAQQASQPVQQKVAKSPEDDNSRESSGNAGLGGDAPQPTSQETQQATEQMSQMAIASEEPAAEQVVEPPQQPVDSPPPKEEVEHIQQSQPESTSPPPMQSSPTADEEDTASADHGSELTKDQQGVMDAVQEMDSREHINVVFIGHVDAGKSTIGGQILYLTGGVDERTIQKYEKEAKDKNRESWYMAYIMDTNEEERAKGKTVEVGRAHFETEAKRYTILDAPGHKNYVPNMIGGAALADVGVLVISARKAEFEAGFERGGQTREHAQLAKTLGVTKIIVAVNKMDEPSIVGPNGEWSQARYKEIQDKLTPFLKGCGYNPKKDIVFLPISGLFGDNILKSVDTKKIAPWYKDSKTGKDGPTLFEVLDATEVPARDALSPFRMAIIDKFKDMGTMVMGKSEAGCVQKGDTLLVMPNKTKVHVSAIFCDDTEVNAAQGGENLRLRLSGIDEEDVQSGFVVCDSRITVPVVSYFEAQLQILELLDHKSLFSAGYKCILHIHAAVEECECTQIKAKLDMKTKQKLTAKFVKSGAAVICTLAVEKPICVELFKDVPQLGRFTLRDEGRTIAIGKITKLPSHRNAQVSKAT